MRRMIQVTRLNGLGTIAPAPVSPGEYCPSGMSPYYVNGQLRCTREASKGEKLVVGLLVGGLVFALIGLAVWRLKLVAEGKLPVYSHHGHHDHGDFNVYL